MSSNTGSLAADNALRDSRYLPGVDGLRSLAVLSVMLYHLDAQFLPGGFAGVDVFFVISGYVVSRAMIDRGAHSPGHFFVDFFARRFVRILPALMVCLTLTSLLTVLFVPQSWLSSTVATVGAWAYFGVSNFALLEFNDGYFSPRAEYNVFTHTWSLGVEEQFYLVLPGIVLFWLWRGRGEGVASRVSRLLLPVLAGLSLLYAWWLGGENPAAAYYMLPARFWELAAGAMLYLAQHRGVCRPLGQQQAAILLWLGLSVIFAGFWFCDGSAFPFPWAMVPVTGTLLCLAVVSSPPANGSSSLLLLDHPVAIYIGRISYSLYLWHWPVYALFRWTLGLDGLYMAMAVAITFVLAILSYHAVEQPIRNNGWLRKQRPLAKVAAGIAAMVLLAWLSNGLFANKSALDLSVTRDVRTWYPHPYPEAVGNGQPKLLAGRKMIVTGNSHTPAYSTLLQMAQDRLGVEVVQIPMGRCSLGDLVESVLDKSGCAEQVEGLLNRFESELSAGDIVFFASLRTWRLIDQWAVFDYGVSERWVEMSDVATRAAARQTMADVLEFDDLQAYMASPPVVAQRRKALAEAADAIQRLREKGVQVLMDAPKPILQIPPFRCSDWFNHRNPICTLGPAVSRAQLLQLREPAMASLSELRSRYDNIVVWDPFPLLCPGAVCSAYDDEGAPLFTDGDHLSAHGNRVLYPDFAEVLLAISAKGDSRRSALP